MLRRVTQAFAIVFVVFFVTQTCFAQNSGADIFKAKCAMCHGDDGLGNPAIGKALGVVSYKAPAVLKLSDSQLTTIIKNGKNKMPAFGKQLTDAQIKAVLQHIHALQKK
jgi:mono/diheme cytochrome c family protein